jgi:hypothetical protein
MTYCMYVDVDDDEEVMCAYFDNLPCTRKEMLRWFMFSKL